MPRGVYPRSKGQGKAISEGMKRNGYRPTQEHRDNISKSVRRTLSQKALGRLKECDKAESEV